MQKFIGNTGARQLPQGYADYSAQQCIITDFYMEIECNSNIHIFFSEMRKQTQ